MKMHVIVTPKNLWFGVSVTKQEDVWRLDSLRNALPNTVHKFVSFEPLHEHIDADLRGIEWVIIGAETGHRKGKILPEMTWILDLVGAAQDLKIPVFVKDNISKETCYHFGPEYRQFPEDALVEERAEVAFLKDRTEDRLVEECGDVWEAYEDIARGQLQAEGKIGPEDAKPRSWQITDERKDALRDAVDRYDVVDRCLVIHKRKMQNVAVLRAMLEEASQ